MLVRKFQQKKKLFVSYDLFSLPHIKAIGTISKKALILIENIHFVTSGRPIFYQFAYMLMAKGFNDILWEKLIQPKAAKDFLYGRIYDYLSDDATDLLITIGMLLNDKDDKYLIDCLKYIVNMEDDNDKFARAMNELLKLRIIEELDRSTFRVYSKDLLNVMKEHKNKKIVVLLEV
ncbi:hypothetical protein [Neobacillus mesonae]|uniref:hypothetical protein n=1 Tax=Neobacillus mesonae TaxID=1193713 RepID=UPI002573E2F7|nr:hypothetical protein [Neobacillus mesonae]